MFLKCISLIEQMNKPINILTKKEQIVLRAIQKFFNRSGKMPTVRELQKEMETIGLKVRSVGSVFLYLKSLQEKGFIHRRSQKRGIEMIGSAPKRFVNIPIFGTANAGSPTCVAEQNLEGVLKVSNKIASQNFFAIQIDGDSMNLANVKGKQIENGDYVIVNPSDKRYHDGDKLLITIDGLATVKKFKRFPDGTIGLFPESTNKEHKPIYLTAEDEPIINGKVVDVLKNA